MTTNWYPWGGAALGLVEWPSDPGLLAMGTHAFGSTCHVVRAVAGRCAEQSSEKRAQIEALLAGGPLAPEQIERIERAWLGMPEAEVARNWALLSAVCEGGDPDIEIPVSVAELCLARLAVAEQRRPTATPDAIARSAYRARRRRARTARLRRWLTVAGVVAGVAFVLGVVWGYVGG